MQMNQTIASNKLKRIQLLLLDVDGVLTTGDIIYTEHDKETKIFSVKDGLGLRLLMKAGVTVGIITGRRSKALRQRCTDLGIELLFEGIADKVACLEGLLAQTGIGVDATAFVGDDLPDLPVMNQVALGIAVADASESVRSAADMVTEAGGGRGAVREVCESILKAKGLWESVVARFNQ